ncbi:MAG: tetratricopeptide repeat protein, partial [Bacteroidetes bacterium]|nr:tetratricopeptide repeat protein [Bacteroidota bacterium]
MKKNLFHIIILTAMLNFAGCGVFSSVADFTKQGYTNTVAYFNTYYNAQRLYNEAVSEMERTIAAAQEKPSNIPYSKIPLTPAARQKFSSSIEKNSKLLSYYPNSTWVDDALLMIGKSYIYLENNVKAERKFLELFAKYPNSDLIPEAKLFYGKALLNQKKEKEGVANLQALYEESQQNGDKTIAADAALSLGQYYAENKEYETAIPLLQASLKYSSDDAINAQTEMRIADCYAAMQNYKEAETAYRNVERYTPIYFQYFRSRIEMVKMVRAQKQFSDVLDLLNNLLSDAKNTEYAATIHFEIANTFLAMDSLNTAIEKFQYVDTAFVRTDEAARSYFVLANLFEKKFLLYDSAKALYDKAKAEFPQSDISAEAARKSDIFGKYASLWKDIVKNDSLYTRNDSAAITIDTLQLAKQFV